MLDQTGRPIHPGPLPNHSKGACAVTDPHLGKELLFLAGRGIGGADRREIGARFVGNIVGGVTEALPCVAVDHQIAGGGIGFRLTLLLLPRRRRPVGVEAEGRLEKERGGEPLDARGNRDGQPVYLPPLSEDLFAEIINLHGMPWYPWITAPEAPE